MGQISQSQRRVLAIQTVERSADLKDENVNTAVDTLDHPQPIPRGHGLLGRISAHIHRDLLTAFLGWMKRSGIVSNHRQQPKAVGVLPADLEYLTNVAARAQGDVWLHLIMGKGQGSKRGWY